MLFPKIFKEESIKFKGVDFNFAHGGIKSRRTIPLLLIHGYPQTHIMWHKVVEKLAEKYYVICPDLIGYGDSSKPRGMPDHKNYSKKSMAEDMINIMDYLMIDEFYIAGHDRGARVAHRMCLDYPERVRKACLMDIAPTYHMFENTDKSFATGYYHWFFLIQPDNLPETLIRENPKYYLTEKLKRWSDKDVDFYEKFDEEAVKEYVRCFDEDSIHATCEDYRAAATIDMEDDENDRKTKLKIPLLVLWGKYGFINKTYDVLNVWKDYALNVNGKALECGHFLPEEKPKEVIEEMIKFFK
ncbi:MAG: alpha/beta hydrolase [Arcobacter sp.]|nr:MAG: alpha/beta hydrolase [Arcobacter sp.]